MKKLGAVGSCRPPAQASNVIHWADSFIQSLLTLKEEERGLNYKLLSPSTKEQLVSDFNNAGHRLLLLDYDGTLSKLEKYPQLAKPTEELLKTIKLVSDNPKNEVVLISGRDKITLQSWFGSLNVGSGAGTGYGSGRKKKTGGC